MRFGSFVFSISSDPEQDHQVIENTLKEIDLAEEIGLDAVWLTEHHFDGAVAFAAFADFVVDQVAFGELLNAHALDCRVMEEHVVPISLDESTTLVRHQLLNLTLWHLCPPLKQKYNGGGRNRFARNKRPAQNQNESRFAARQRSCEGHNDAECGVTRRTIGVAYKSTSCLCFIITT